MAKSKHTTLISDAIAAADTTVNPLGEKVERQGGGFKGLVDRDLFPKKGWVDHIPPGNLKSTTQAEQYSNPRGFVGLAGIQFNRKMGDPPINEYGEKKRAKSRQMARTGKP
jgi:hypothetical protein